MVCENGLCVYLFVLLYCGDGEILDLYKQFLAKIEHLKRLFLEDNPVSCDPVAKMDIGGKGVNVFCKRPHNHL
ncbi:hypothetical protein GDO78_001296 [Eleutherodactylus coqui]|uniref:Uncharacterized protein n=1 Tax=Eleutherodactylus coqui TaxID=57060 RepID=A0A8J6FST3_ELECQ|nr:hypothetical protein GDO78_001296 [Eleutherodactylus coqui]